MSFIGSQSISLSPFFADGSDYLNLNINKMENIYFGHIGFLFESAFIREGSGVILSTARLKFVKYIVSVQVCLCGVFWGFLCIIIQGR